MFPEQFVEKHLIWSEPKDLVLDPFCGRGTTIFEALLRGREGLGGDTNPVAVCVSSAKADPPALRELLDRIVDLEQRYDALPVSGSTLPEGDFFDLCFHRRTLEQLVFLRGQLKLRKTRSDRFIAALVLGSLHGESHRSEWCFSNRMPRTISTKPEYSVRWWRQNHCLPPDRDIFRILRAVARFRYESPPPPRRGRVARIDARKIGKRFADQQGRVGLVITSPPYIDTTHYLEDQWLRIWFLGGPERPAREVKSDDRHTNRDNYWRFLTEAWAGVAPLLRDGAQMVIRIGGRRLDPKEAGQELRTSLRTGTGGSVRLLEHRESRIAHGQLRSFRPGILGTQMEHDFRFRIG